MAVYFYLCLFLTLSWLFQYLLYFPHLYALSTGYLSACLQAKKQKRMQNLQMAGCWNFFQNWDFFEKFLLNWWILKTDMYKTHTFAY